MGCRNSVCLYIEVKNLNSVKKKKNEIKKGLFTHVIFYALHVTRDCAFLPKPPSVRCAGYSPAPRPPPPRYGLSAVLSPCRSDRRPLPAAVQCVVGLWRPCVPLCRLAWGTLSGGLGERPLSVYALFSVQNGKLLLLN